MKYDRRRCASVNMATCDNCGQQLPDGAQYCGRCGKATGVGAPNVEYRPIPDSGKSKMLALILAGILGLVGIWGIGQIYLGNIGKGVLFLAAGLVLAFLVVFTFPICSILFLLLGAAGYVIQLLDVLVTPV